MGVDGSPETDNVCAWVSGINKCVENTLVERPQTRPPTGKLPSDGSPMTLVFVRLTPKAVSIGVLHEEAGDEKTNEQNQTVSRH